MNSKVRTGLLVIKEEKRVIVGEGPFLAANLVTRFFGHMTNQSRGVEIVSYTEPRGTRFDIEGGKFLGTVHPLR